MNRTPPGDCGPQTQLLSGHPDIEGLCLPLVDSSGSLRPLQAAHGVSAAFLAGFWAFVPALGLAMPAPFWLLCALLGSGGFLRGGLLRRNRGGQCATIGVFGGVFGHFGGHFRSISFAVIPCHHMDRFRVKIRQVDCLV
jgi:hypothetical protein